MSQLYCAYKQQATTEHEAEAVRKCDSCDKLLCRFCGYISEDGKDFCNECWINELTKEAREILS